MNDAFQLSLVNRPKTEQAAARKGGSMNSYRIAVAGNPNCGKTTLFNALTGARQRVGNWPGVTVDRKEGSYSHDGAEFTVVDLPGTYSLSTTSVSGLDESIARDYVLSGEADLVVNIVDASNLERNLYLTTQLLEMRVPMIVAVNMMDVAHDRGLDIDIPKLALGLGVPVVPIVAAHERGIDDLKDLVHRAARDGEINAIALPYPPVILGAITNLVADVTHTARRHKLDPHWLAVKSLAGDTKALSLIDENVRSALPPLLDEIGGEAGEDADILIADGRYGFANALVRDAVGRKGRVSTSWSDRIDHVILNRVLGIPIFLAVMYLMFLFTINFAGAFIDFFDQVAGALFVDGPAALMERAGAPAWSIALLPKGIGAGIQTVATFIPVIGFLFLFLTFLEDSGYMARAAFVMDRAMRAIGLPGKSFVPMLLGFGCTVPAVMATRTLENRRDRLMTAMMAPFMSCGARLPVYALFAAAFFSTGGQNLVFGLYLIGIAFAVLTGMVLKNTLFHGDATPFVMELPPYHMPILKSVLLRTWDRLKQFLFKAGKIIVMVVFVLSFLNSVGPDGSFGHEDSEQSVLASIGKGLTPVVEPMGISEENWPATVGLFTGVFAKEAVVGTLNALYGQLADEASGGQDEGFEFWDGVAGAFATIPANLMDALGGFADPLGLDIGDISTPEAAAQDQEISIGVFGAMVSRFDGKVGAFAYLIAVLLYMPCVAATAAMFREVGLRWTVFAIVWTTSLAYGASVAVYQIGTFARHPTSSMLWLAAIAVLFVTAIVLMRWRGRRDAAPPAYSAT